MSESTLAKLKRLQKSYARGEKLFSQGDETHDLYVLMEGEVTVYREDQKIAVINKSGAFIGEIGALLKQPRSATCISTRSSTVLCVAGDKIEHFFQMSPSVAFKLATVLAERLNDMNKKIMAIQEEDGEFNSDY